MSHTVKMCKGLCVNVDQQYELCCGFCSTSVPHVQKVYDQAKAKFAEKGVRFCRIPYFEPELDPKVEYDDPDIMRYDEWGDAYKPDPREFANQPKPQTSQTQEQADGVPRVSR